MENICSLASSKIFAILRSSGSALVIYKYSENKCELTIFVNDLITNIINLQNNFILQYTLFLLLYHVGMRV